MLAKKRRVKFVTFLDLKDKREQSSYFFGILIVLSYILVILTFPLSLCVCLKVGLWRQCFISRLAFSPRWCKNMNEQ